MTETKIQCLFSFVVRSKQVDKANEWRIKVIPIRFLTLAPTSYISNFHCFQKPNMSIGVQSFNSIEMPNIAKLFV